MQREGDEQAQMEEDGHAQPERNQPCPYHDLRFAAFSTAREEMSVVSVSGP